MSGLDRDIAPIVADELKRYMPDLVKVVRCKDCIHAKEMTQYGCGECVRHCEKLKIVTSPDWYCAAGARNGAAAKEAEEALSEVQTFVEGKRKDEAIIQN